MKKIKVFTIVGTRPEIIRLSRVIAELERTSEHTLVHTGQNYDYELNQVFFDDLGIKKPDYFLDSAIEGGSAANTIGNLISKVDIVLRKVLPDAVLILGDTNSCLSVIPAKRLQIPIFHMEAGNRCFDLRVPEEINRKIVDHTSDINLTYSSIAREYLLREGLPPDQIIKTGSPMQEVLNFYKTSINNSKILKKLELDEKNYFLISAHREENVQPKDNFKKLTNILNKLAENFELDVIVSTHPRTREKINEMNSKFHSNVRLLKPLGFFDYVKLQTKAKLVLSDSGTISEESSILNFPALNIREVHERPEAMEEVPVMMTGLEYERIEQCINVMNDSKNNFCNNSRIVADYSMPNVSVKVVKIIHSYINFVNRVTWKKI